MEWCLERDGSLAEAELELRMPVGAMEDFAGIKLFNKVIDRIGVDMDQQKRYEVFDHIYEAVILSELARQDYSRCGISGQLI